MIKRFLACLVLLLAVSSHAATTYYSALVTVTNPPAAGATITVDGSERTWATNVANAATDILTNYTTATATANLLTHFASAPVSGISIQSSGSTAVTFRGANDGSWFEVALSAGWGTVAYTTNTLTAATVVRMPITVETDAAQTNIASSLAAAINSDANTNAIEFALLSASSTNAQSATYATNAGTATLAGSATNATYLTGQLTNYLFIPASALGYASNSPASFGTNSVGGNVGDTVDFDDTTDENSMVSLALQGWDLSPVQFKFYYTAPGATNSVVWRVSGVSFGEKELYSTALGTAVNITNNWSGTNATIQITGATADVTIGGTPAKGDLVLLQFTRDADNASDTLTGDARLLGVMMRYTGTNNPTW